MVNGNNPLDSTPSPALETLQLVHGLIDESHDASNLMISERSFAVQRRILTSSPAGHIAVSRFAPQDQYAVGRLLSVTLNRSITQPKALIEGSHQVESSRVEANIYVRDDEVVSAFEMIFKPGDYRTLVAQDCFAFADYIGVGGQWTNGVLAHLRGEARSPYVHVGAMTDPKIEYVNSAIKNMVEG